MNSQASLVFRIFVFLLWRLLMRRCFVCAAFFVLFLQSCLMVKAADVSLSADVNSAYVWRGITWNDGIVVQPSFLIGNGGFEAYFWANINIDDYDGTLETEEISEVDIDVSYGGEVLGVDWRVGVVEYTYPNDGSLVSTNGEDTLVHGTGEVYALFSRTITGGLSLGLDVYYDFDEVEDFYGKLGVSYEQALGEGTLLTAGAAIGAVGSKASLAGEGGLHEYEISAEAAHGFESGLGLKVYVAYTDTLDKKVLPEQDTNVYGGMSIKYLF